MTTQPAPSSLVFKGMSTSKPADHDEDDAATLRDAADVLRRQQIDVPDALAVLDMVADMLDPELMEEEAETAASYEVLRDAIADAFVKQHPSPLGDKFIELDLDAFMAEIAPALEAYRQAGQ